MDKSYFKRINYSIEDISYKRYNKLGYRIQKDTLFEIKNIKKDIKEGRINLEKDFNIPKPSRAKNTGLGQGYIDQCLKNFNAGYSISIPKNFKSDKPIFIKYLMDKENNRIFDLNKILIKNNADVTVVLYYSSANTEGYRNGILNVEIEDNARLKLIVIQSFSDQDKNFDTSNIYMHNSSKLEYYSLDLGSNINSRSCSVYMMGDKGTCYMNPIYYLDSDRKIDIEHNLFVTGKNSKGDISCVGALNDNATKVSRGNIFLNTGCSKSVTKYSSNDIMLSDSLKCTSIPTIMCDEDNVIGEHGASFVAIDKDKLYYLMSRGLSKDAAKKVIIESIFKPIINKIKSAYVRNKLIKKLEVRLNAID